MKKTILTPEENIINAINTTIKEDGHITIPEIMDFVEEFDYYCIANTQSVGYVDWKVVEFGMEYCEEETKEFQLKLIEGYLERLIEAQEMVLPHYEIGILVDWLNEGKDWGFHMEHDFNNAVDVLIGLITEKLNESKA